MTHPDDPAATPDEPREEPVVAMRRSMLSGAIAVVAVIGVAIGGPWLVRQVRTLPRTSVLAARADQRVVTLEIGGMTCAGCAAKVGEQLSAVNGVATAEVRLAQRRAYVVCDRSVPDSALTAAVGRAGPGFLGDIATH